MKKFEVILSSNGKRSLIVKADGMFIMQQHDTLCLYTDGISSKENIVASFKNWYSVVCEENEDKGE